MFCGMKQLQERDFLRTPCLDRDIWEGRAGRCHQPSSRYKAFPQLVGITAGTAVRCKVGTEQIHVGVKREKTKKVAEYDEYF